VGQPALVVAIFSILPIAAADIAGSTLHVLACWLVALCVLTCPKAEQQAEGTDMLARLAYVMLLTLPLIASSGCCRCCRGWHDGNFCASSCGECYWSEWFNDPPACCDPCDCYGNYAGHRHRPATLAGYHAPEPTLATPEMVDGMEEMPTPAIPTPGRPTPAYPGMESNDSEPAPGRLQPSVPEPSEIESSELQPGGETPGQDILDSAPDQSIDDALGVPATE
jgi:hypothetical protein